MRPAEMEALLNAGLGRKVFFPSTAEPVGGAWSTLFTIAGGIVMVTSLVGIRTVVQAGGASTMQLRHSVGPTVQCTATAVTGDAVGTLYTITGNPNDALVIGAAGAPIQGGMGGSQVVVSQQQFGSFMGAGTIQISCSAAGHTGSTRWILTYIPMDYGAMVS